MDIDKKWKEDFLAQLDKTIERGSVNKETLELMKELLKNAKLKSSITEYYKDQK